MTDPRQVTDVRFIFNTTQGDSRSLYLDMTATWPQWVKFRFATNVPSREMRVLRLMYGMNVVNVDRLMKAAGIIQNYEDVDVYWSSCSPKNISRLVSFPDGKVGGGLRGRVSQEGASFQILRTAVGMK